MAYAWIIDTDHVDGDDPKYDGTGAMGPGQAPDALCEALQSRRYPSDAEVFHFRMKDDDGELYYSGRLITTEGKTEQACAAPLDNYGRPNAGAVTVLYDGHPEMDIG